MSKKHLIKDAFSTTKEIMDVFDNAGFGKNYKIALAESKVLHIRDNLRQFMKEGGVSLETNG